ncbi:STAS domain-containing protein [Kitasatospora sp. NPDC058190]|uniref:STAS domain-containing protein n=1 Tax=Kitasatospora sp. NPDC058190 TaxID=3346371 RepID=UPI0036DCF59F
MSTRQPFRFKSTGIAAPLLRISTARTPGGAEVVRLDGEVDQDQRVRLQRALDRAVGDRPQLLVVDLSGLAFCDSTCLNVLLSARAAAQAAGVELVLAALSSQARRLLEITGTDEVFTVRDSVRAALAGNG